MRQSGWQLVVLCSMATCLSVSASGDETTPAGKTLAVHLVQANNESPYTLVRARFEPGEVQDPWQVSFSDESGNEVPFFVWDSVTWKVAREGRPDWGHRYALLNHGSGRSAEAVESRGKKIAAARDNAPELAALLEAREEAARQFANSTCAALYLLRYPVPPFGKARLTLRLEPASRPGPRSFHALGDRVGQRTQIDCGQLRLENLPDQLTVVWKGKKIFRYAGFEAGDAAGDSAHADPTLPFAMDVTEGLITKVMIEGQTRGRRSSPMRWQCTYWLFPEGSYAALEGFSLGNAEGYLGGDQILSSWQAPGGFALVHEPTWNAPWSLYRVGDESSGTFVTVHQFLSTPWTIGYGNNPFTASPSGSEKTVASRQNLDLVWGFDITQRAIYRLFQRRLPVPAPQDPGPSWLSRDVFLTGKLAAPPANMSAQEVESIEAALRCTRWESDVDWLYRQYLVGVGETAQQADSALRQTLGAAGGWIDRPLTAEELATLLARAAFRVARRDAPQPNQDVYSLLPYLVEGPDPEGAAQALRTLIDLKDATANHMRTIQNHIAAGENGITGRWVENPHGEGWESNPAYHACSLPTSLRFLEHFDLLRSAPRPAQEYRAALLGFADFSVKVLGGDPFDPEKFCASLHLCWPNRMVMLFPLVLHAYRLESDERFATAAQILFDELMAMVQTNPHGYWAAWRFAPDKAAVFDTVYNPVGYQRGITAFWAEDLVDLIGRDKASRFVAAQARYAVVSGQFLDTFEQDNLTGVHAYFHHAHPSFSAQIALYLYDDFAFYRGLVGELVRWSVAGGGGALDGYYSPLFRWTFGIGPGSSWYHRQMERLADRPGAFRIRIQNQLPWSRCSFWVRSDDVGMQPSGKWLLWAQTLEPTFRRETVLEVRPIEQKVVLDVERATRLRLAYTVYFPDVRSPEQVALTAHPANGPPTDVVQRTEWGSDGTGESYVEWTALPGRYELAHR